MSTTTPMTVLVCPERRTQVLARAADYVELTKPKIAVLVLATVAVSSALAATGPLDGWRLLHTLLGTALVAASASALNQWLERHSDALMARTADRPLPAGRLSTAEVTTFGWITAALGIAYLAWAVNLQVALLGCVTWATYVWVYTPLKSRTWLNTVVGAVAGALPVLMGAAAMGQIDLGALTLFLIVYLWQFPHFMAIAWIYRREYAAAGLKMLSVIDPSGRRAGLQAVSASLALLPVSLLPVAMHQVPLTYGLAALVLGGMQAIVAGAFFQRLDERTARRLLRASLVYLPGVLVLFVLGRVV
jgi:protoheme IX farnesyltransferase